MMLGRLLCFFVNSLCCFLYRKEYRDFIGTRDIENVQKEKLLEILSNNRRTEYGQKFDFSSIRDVSEYQERLTLTTYEDYIEYIEKIKDGGTGILTEEDVLLLEPTSGSVSPSKYIPYTLSLKNEFQKALKPWIYNLYQSYTGIKWGKSYWSITPATRQKEYTKGGIPIGFEEDSEYFGNLEKKLMDIIFAVDGDVAKEKDMDEFYRKTAIELLKCKNLTLISVWNPTFLILLLQYMEDNADTLCNEISVKDKRRGLKLREWLYQKDYESIWKRLKVISCWCDGNAKEYALRLKEIFPKTAIQAKGLLATEGVVSFPFAGEDGARISLYSHFFEFLSLKDGQIYLAHELEEGEEYSVIITTSGGLYRYKMKDVVEVIGFRDVFPLVRFKGKEDKVSDLFGEKLNEVFIRDAMEDIMARQEIKPEFYMMAPEIDRYVLYIKSHRIPANVEEALRENFHYDYCRNLGQLKGLRIFRLTGNPEQEYIDECVKHGQRLGDIKPTALSLISGWDRVFKGEYL